MDEPILLLGAPGTGKTQALIDEILLSKPHSFAFLTFTRRAANEAKTRLKPFFNTQQLKYTRTIHSLCFELGGLRKEQVMNAQQIYKFADECGYDLHPRRASVEDGSIYQMSEDDIDFRQLMIVRARMDIEGMRSNPLFRPYFKYMFDHGFVDYHQMLGMGTDAIKRGYDVPHFDMLLVDELQDLTPIQIAFIDELIPHCKRVIFAGDDNQMIFEWAGVDRKSFMNTAEHCRPQFLTENHRLPKDICELANLIALKQGEATLTGFDGRYSIPRTNSQYSIHYTTEDSLVFEPDQQYLLLARNGYILDAPTVGLSWEDREWSWLDEEKNTLIKASTIHGAKGAEADNVILYTDVSPATYENLDEDSEHRVWYVAVTRARKKLYIVAPQTDKFYDLE